MIQNREKLNEKKNIDIAQIQRPRQSIWSKIRQKKTHPNKKNEKIQDFHQKVDFLNKKLTKNQENEPQLFANI